MIKNALTRAEGKKRKRRDSDDGKAKSKVNFTRPRCYSEEVELLEEEMQRTLRFFVHYKIEWMSRATKCKQSGGAMFASK